MKGIISTLVIHIIVFACLIPSPLSAEEILRLGGGEGWDHISRLDSVTFREGIGGYRNLLLQERSYSVASPAEKEQTELLLHFDRAPFRDSAGGYRISEPRGARLSSKARFGQGSARFVRNNEGLTLIPESDTLFGGTMAGGSFSIEFWLYPYLLEDGETILEWNGQNMPGEELHMQKIRVSVQERAIRWNFGKIFFSSDFEPRSVELSGIDPLIPKEWHHHLLTFDGERGLLQYYVDGKPQALAYLTDTGGEEGSIHRPYIGESSGRQLALCPAFGGLVDEMRITREHVTEPILHPYSYESGEAVSELIDLDSFGTRLISISAVHSTPPETDIFFFYRLYDTIGESIREKAAWRQFTPGASLPETARGRYLQLRFLLYPDGAGTHSPLISSLTIAYEPNFPPLPPGNLKAKAGNGQVRLSWNPTMEEDAAGYLLFYGTESGVYRGRKADRGNSPIDMGEANETVITGLDNGKVYYFSVAAYDRAGRKNRGKLSEEVSARPTPYAEEE